MALALATLMNALTEKIKRELGNIRLWRGLCVIEALAFSAAICFVVYSMSQDLRVIVVNGTTHYFGPAKTLQASEEEHIIAAKMAASAIFSRTGVQTEAAPNGFMFWENLCRITSKDMLDQLLKISLQDKQAFAQDRITESFAPAKVVQEEVSSDTTDMRIDGTIIKNKIVDGVAKTESQRAQVWMKLIENRSWDTNFKFPLLVVSMKVNILDL